jgi:hypothetical protein
MDAIGARELRERLAEQEHWRQAKAVREGHQAPTDPDYYELEEMGKRVRRYGVEQQRTTVNGRPAIVTLRLTKTLIGDRWETSLVIEATEYLEEI